jgi:ABC-type polar amino acid transport system ATPase subunit
MIRCINRLEEHQRGQIFVDGVELTNDLKKIDEVRRDVGMVFQHFNLFPHLTVMENCTLAPIWVRKMAKKDAEEVAIPLVHADDVDRDVRRADLHERVVDLAFDGSLGNLGHRYLLWPVCRRLSIHME